MSAPALSHGRTPHSSTEGSMIEVADDVFAYVQAPGGWCVSNAGVVVGGDGAVVVDTLATERRARRLRAEVDRLTAGPGRTVVNTHHHGDHVFGNHLFGPGAAVVAHELARAEMVDTGLALTSLWPSVDWGDVRVTPPTIVLRDRLDLYAGDRRLELLHVGPAHTTNDVVVWLPAERVLFAGDVVMAGVAPFNLMGSVSGAIEALLRLRDLDPVTVVGGHGPVAGPEVIEANLAYLRWIQEAAAEGHARGLSPLELAYEVGTGEFGHLLDAERVVGNLHRAYAELAGGTLGRPLDVVAVFMEMVTYNDGRLPTCLA